MTAPTVTAARVPALARIAAGMAVASAGVHLLLHDGSSLGSLVMVLLAAACLPCAWHLWRFPTPSVWRATALVDAAMLVLHAQLLGSGDHAHHAAAPSSLMWLGLALVSGQLVLAGTAALRRP